MQRLLWFLATICLSGAAVAQTIRTSPLVDTRPLPFLAPVGQLAYLRYLGINLPRAIAISPSGGFGWFGGDGTIEDARAQALKSCADKVGAGCTLYAEDLETVWPSARRPAPPAPPAAPLISGEGYDFVADDRYVWQGPAAARGVYVWAHGFDSDVDSRGRQPQMHVRAFNNAGFDVVRFDRDPIYDEQRDAMAANLQSGLMTLRKRGWKLVVAAGQSRGAWNSLQILATPGIADVVIAVSPAAHGTDPGDMITRQETDLWQLLHNARSPGTRVAFVQFAEDPYSAIPEHRLALIDSQLRPRVGPVLVIDRPTGILGHYGGGSADFAMRYADCLLHFAIDAKPPSACGSP